MYSWFGSGRKLQFWITAHCLNAWVLLGYDQGVFAGILQSADWHTQFGNPNDTHIGIIVACFDLGCFLGCCFSFFLGARIGRIRTMWWAALTITIGAAIQCSAYSVAQLIVGRILTGVGTGINSSTVPTYQAELCPKHLRGRLLSSQLLIVGVGITIAYWFNFGMSYVSGSIAWRLPLAMQIVFSLIEKVSVLGVPESPRWLFTVGRHEEAIRLLALSTGEAEDSALVQEQTAEIKQALELEEIGNQTTWKKMFTQDSVCTRERVLLAFGCHFMNQMGGINLVVYYIPSVLVQNVGMTPRLATILGGCINMSLMVGSAFPSFMLDRMGRRITLMWGTCMVGGSMMFIAILLSIGSKAASMACIAFFFTYIITFGASLNCVPWAYPPEILPLEARTKAVAAATSSNWIWNFLVVMITPIIINRLKWKAYLIFTITNFAFFPLVYFFYPETSNKSLEEIDFMFSNGATGLPFRKNGAAFHPEGGNVNPQESTTPSDSGEDKGTVTFVDNTTKHA